MSEQQATEIRTLEGTASFFEVSLPTVREWLRKGCPVVTKGANGKAYELDLRAVHDWRQGIADREQAEAERIAEADAQLRLELFGDDTLPDPEALGRLSIRKSAEWLSIELNKIRVAKERRELVSAELVKLEMVQAASLLGTRLRSLPDQLARRHSLTEDQVAAMLEDIDAMLNDLANEIAGLEIEGDDRDLAA